MTAAPEFIVTEDTIRVGFGDYEITDNQSLVTFGLGTCVGVSMHDPESGVGGFLHSVLPNRDFDSSVSRDAFYVVDGVTAMYQELVLHPKVDGSKLEAKVVGGMDTSHKNLCLAPVGKLNKVGVLRTLNELNIDVTATQSESTGSCSVIFNPTPGMLIIRTPESSVRQL
jgi:chemotaxis protein CheD